MSFVYLHMGWFAFWILLNVGLLGSALVFDDFPFGLLTLIVSLEAIFLSTFVMISQNREASRAEMRASLDFETNLAPRCWSMRSPSTPASTWRRSTRRSTPRSPGRGPSASGGGSPAYSQVD